MVALFLILQQFGLYIPALGLNTYGGLMLIYLGSTLGRQHVADQGLL